MSDADHAWLARSVYLPDDERTGGLEWARRFAAEMHPDGRSPLRWIGSMAPLFRPGDGTLEGPRRSSQMLYCQVSNWEGVGLGFVYPAPAAGIPLWSRWWLLGLLLGLLTAEWIWRRTLGLA
jgi:hypothetical protein